MSAPTQPRPSDTSYRIVCYEIEDGHETVIRDETARGYLLVTGTLDENGTMHGHGTYAGPKHLTRRLARLIADDELLAD